MLSPHEHVLAVLRGRRDGDGRIGDADEHTLQRFVVGACRLRLHRRIQFNRLGHLQVGGGDDHVLGRGDVQFGLIRALAYAPVHLHPVAHLHLDRVIAGEDKQSLGGSRIAVRFQPLHPEALQFREDTGDHSIRVHKVQFVGGTEARPLDGIDGDAIADEGEQR